MLWTVLELKVVSYVRRLLARILPQSIIRALYGHRRMATTYLKQGKIHKLQIGSGGNILPGWLNTNITPTKGVMFMDATKRFPFGECTFDYVFTEHFIEHLEYPVGAQLVRECYRVLKHGGRLRISTPDLSFLIELHDENKTEQQKRYIMWATDKFIHNTKSYADTFVINNFFRDFGHKFIYDYKTLKTLLTECGFVDVERYQVGKSQDENLRGIESHGRVIGDDFNTLESMVVEATKPPL